MDVNKYTILDPRIDTNNTSYRNWYNIVGSSNSTYQVFSTQNFSNSNMNFDIILPNNDMCVIDRSTVVISIPVRITLANTAPPSADPAYQTLRMALRSYCLPKIVQSLVINMNGNSLSYQASEMAIIQERFTDNSDNLQIMPTFCDPGQLYNDSYNTNMSPFASRFSNTDQISRSAYPMVTIGPNTSTGCIIDTVIHWNLCDYYPFSRDHDLVGLNITPFTISLNFVNQLTRLWSYDVSCTNFNATSTFTVNIGGNSLKSFPEISMLVMSTPQPLPPTLSYPFYQCVYYPSQTSVVAAGATMSSTSSVIQLQTLPSRIYIYPKISTSTILATSINAAIFPDVFGKINSLSITLGNKNNLLSNATPEFLFTMTKKNGLLDYITYSDWIGRNGASAAQALCGGIVCIDPSRDLSLDGTEMVGLSSKINFQVTLNWTSLASNAYTYDIGVMLIYDGLQIMSNGQCILTNTLFSSVSELQQSPFTYKEIKDMYGGAMAGSAKSFFHNVFGTLKKAIGPVNEILKSTKLISKAANYIPYVGPVVSPIAQALGYGDDQDFYGGENECDTGGFMSSAHGAGVLAGGKQLRRSTLKQNAQRFRKY